MASTVFQDYNPATPIVAAWLNDVNTATYVTVPANSSAIGTLQTEVAELQSEISTGIQPVGASVSGNALTVSLAATVLTFRSTTLASGATTTVATPALTSLIVPSGATLGTISAVQSRLILLALNNAGTVALGIVNIAGGVNLDETTLLNTTAISSGATLSNTVYSTAALTGVAFRVIGEVVVTEATAGIWLVAPTLVQGAGGQALAALCSLGYGQIPNNVTVSRSFGTTYYNTTGRPLLVSVLLLAVGGTSTATFSINGVGYVFCGITTNVNNGFTAIVPPGAGYSLSSGGGTYSLADWYELS